MVIKWVHITKKESKWRSCKSNTLPLIWRAWEWKKHQPLPYPYLQNHQTNLCQRKKNVSAKTIRGPRATKYGKNCKICCKSRYKRQNGIIKSLQNLKVLNFNSRHLVDSNKEKSTLYPTTMALMYTFKTLHLD